MNESHISRRYAKAVLSYARDLGEDQALYTRMLMLDRSCAEMPKLVQTLVSPVVAPDDKKALVLGAGGGGGLASYDAFARLVIENQRGELVRNIALAYINMYRNDNNISVIHLTSARPLSDGIRERIGKSVTDRTHGTAEIDIRIDETIGGGFILQVDDRRLDASVKGQLDRIRRQLTGKERKLV